MKKLLFISLAFLTITGCTKVEPGYVGIKVNNYGDQRGVEDFPIVTGRVHFNVFTEDVYKWPVFLQSQIWTENKEDESRAGEHITFDSIEGVTLKADIGFSYRLDPELVPNIFVKHRQDIDAVTDGYVRTKMEGAFNEVGGQMEVLKIMGSEKVLLSRNVMDLLNEELNEEGFKFEAFEIIGSVRSDDPRVQEAINRVLEQKQRALEAEAKVREATAIAMQKVETARGDSLSAVISAAGEAQANITVSRSLTRELIQWRYANAWDGKTPLVMGSGATPLLNLQDLKQ